jgi:hypothetical protein
MRRRDLREVKQLTMNCIVDVTRHCYLVSSN